MRWIWLVPSEILLVWPDRPASADRCRAVPLSRDDGPAGISRFCRVADSSRDESRDSPPGPLARERRQRHPQKARKEHRPHGCPPGDSSRLPRLMCPPVLAGPGSAADRRVLVARASATPSVTHATSRGSERLGERRAGRRSGSASSASRPPVPPSPQLPRASMRPSGPTTHVGAPCGPLHELAATT